MVMNIRGEIYYEDFKSLDSFQSLTKKNMQKFSGGSQADYNFFFIKKVKVRRSALFD